MSGTHFALCLRRRPMARDIVRWTCRPLPTHGGAFTTRGASLSEGVICMKTIIRLQLNMAGSANAFCKAHPDPNPAGQVMAAQLDQLGFRPRRTA